MAPSDVPSNRTLRFVVNGTATERLALLEGGRVAVRLELQVLGLGATASTCEYRGRRVIALPLVASLGAPQQWLTRDDDALGGALQ